MRDMGEIGIAQHQHLSSMLVPLSQAAEVERK